MLLIQDNLQLTDAMAFSFKLSSDFFRWIACKIAGTSTSLSINRKFQFSNFASSRADCITKFSLGVSCKVLLRFHFAAVMIQNAKYFQFTYV